MKKRTQDFELDLYIHGVSLLLTSDTSQAIAAIKEMLYYFVVAKRVVSTKKLLFSFHTVDNSLSFISLPEDVVGVSGEMKYYASPPIIYTSIEGKFITAINIEEKWAKCYMLKNSIDNLWSIAHQAIYPAISELLKLEGIFEMHCATLSRDGRGYLFPAKSGSGKSTLTLSLLFSGFKFLSDDVTFLRSNPLKTELLCCPEPVQLWEDSCAFFPEILGKIKRGYRCKTAKQSFLVENIFPCAIIQSITPSYIFLPSVNREGKSRIEPISRKDALVELIPQSLIPVNQSIIKQHLATLRKVVMASTCFKLSVGSNVRSLSSLLP